MNQDAARVALSGRLRRLRRRAGLSATALAGDTLSVATISRLEHGAIEPSLATLRYLAARLGCSVADLVAVDAELGELREALAEVEAWLLLAAPLPAERRGRALLAAWQRERDGRPDGAAAALLAHLRWAMARAEAALDPAGGAALDPLLAAARHGGDAWAVARLTVARVPSLEAEAAVLLLRSTLAALPDGAGDALDEQVIRAQLLHCFGCRQEADGAEETARSLYRQAVAVAERFCQPALLTRHLLADPPPDAASSSRPPAQRPPQAHGREGAAPLPAPLAIAAVTAGGQVWRAGELALARLDLRAGRLADAARRLRRAQAGGPPDDTVTAAMTAFWGELGRSLGTDRDASWLRQPLEGRPVLDVRTRNDLVVVESALLAGRLEEAERLGAVLASDLAASASDLAQRLWLRLALAWADAGNAPRAARALRAARPVGG